MSSPVASPAPPRSTPVKLAVVAAFGLLVVGAIYLIVVRGPAILLDLSALAGMFCL